MSVLDPASSRTPRAREPAGPLPTEIAFLQAYGVDAAELRRAAEVARATGVTADRVVLTEGLVPAGQFYEALADHLGLPYLRRPLRLAEGIPLDEAAGIEMAAVLPNPEGLTAIAAPRGEKLRTLLARARASRWTSSPRIAVTTPHRLAALVRQHHGRAMTMEASLGLPAWNPRLSGIR